MSPSSGASHKISIARDAPVAQLDRALASGARGYGFDPRRARFFTKKRSQKVKVKSQSHKPKVKILNFKLWF